MVEHKLPKLETRVRFPSSAPIFNFYHEKTSLKEVSLKRSLFPFVLRLVIASVCCQSQKDLTDPELWPIVPRHPAFFRLHVRWRYRDKPFERVST